MHPAITAKHVNIYGNDTEPVIYAEVAPGNDTLYRLVLTPLTSTDVRWKLGFAVGLAEPHVIFPVGLLSWIGHGAFPFMTGAVAGPLSWGYLAEKMGFREGDRPAHAPIAELLGREAIL